MFFSSPSPLRTLPSIRTSFLPRALAPAPLSRRSLATVALRRGRLLRRPGRALLLRLGANAAIGGWGGVNARSGDPRLYRSPWQLLAPGYWEAERKSPGGWRLKLMKRPRFRFQGLEVGAPGEPSGLLQGLRRHRWLKDNLRRLEQRNRPWKPLEEPLLSGRTLGRRHFLLPGQRWGQRVSLRTLRHPRRHSPAILVPLTSTLRYRRARKKVYRYMLRLWENASDYSRARMGMRDFLEEMGDEDPASYPWNWLQRALAWQRSRGGLFAWSSQLPLDEVTVERPRLFRAHKDLDKVLSRGSRFYLRQGRRRFPYRLERRTLRWLRRSGARKQRPRRQSIAGNGRVTTSPLAFASVGPGAQLRRKALDWAPRRSQRRGSLYPALSRRSYPGLWQSRRPTPAFFRGQESRRLHPRRRRSWRRLGPRSRGAWSAVQRHRRLRHELRSPAAAPASPALAGAGASLGRTLRSRHRALVTQARRRRLLRRARGEARPLGRFLNRRRRWPLRALALLEQRRPALRRRQQNPLLGKSRRQLWKELASGERRLRRAWPLFRQLLRQNWPRRSGALRRRLAGGGLGRRRVHHHRHTPRGKVLRPLSAVGSPRRRLRKQPLRRSPAKLRSRAPRVPARDGFNRRRPGLGRLILRRSPLRRSPLRRSTLRRSTLRHRALRPLRLGRRMPGRRRPSRPASPRAISRKPSSPSRPVFRLPVSRQRATPRQGISTPPAPSRTFTRRRHARQPASAAPGTSSDPRLGNRLPRRWFSSTSGDSGKASGNPRRPAPRSPAGDRRDGGPRGNAYKGKKQANNRWRGARTPGRNPLSPDSTPAPTPAGTPTNASARTPAAASPGNSPASPRANSQGHSLPGRPYKGMNRVNNRWRGARTPGKNPRGGGASRGRKPRRRRGPPLPPMLAGDNSERRRRLPSLSRRLSTRRRRRWRRLFDYRQSYTPTGQQAPIYDLTEEERKHFFFYSKRFVPQRGKGNLGFRRYFLRAKDYQRALAKPISALSRPSRPSRPGRGRGTLRPLRTTRRGTLASATARRALGRCLARRLGSGSPRGPQKSSLHRRHRRHRGRTLANRWRRSLVHLSRQSSAVAPLNRGFVLPLTALHPSRAAFAAAPVELARSYFPALLATLVTFFRGTEAPAAGDRARLRWLRSQGRGRRSLRRRPLLVASATTPSLLWAATSAKGRLSRRQKARERRLLGRLSHRSHRRVPSKPAFPRRPRGAPGATTPRATTPRATTPRVGKFPRGRSRPGPSWERLAPGRRVQGSHRRVPSRLTSPRPPRGLSRRLRRGKSRRRRGARARHGLSMPRTFLHPLLSRSPGRRGAAYGGDLAGSWRRRQLHMLGEALAQRRQRRRLGALRQTAVAYHATAALALQRERLLEAYRNGEAAHWQESYATLATPVKRGKRSQLRYAKGRRAELYLLPGDKGFGVTPPPGRRPRSQRGRRGALRRARLSEFLRRHREEMQRAEEAGEEPEPMLLSTRLPESEYLPRQGNESAQPFVPGDPPPAPGGRWKPSLRQRRRPASWLAAPRYQNWLQERRWYPRVHRPDRGFRSVLALRPFAEVDSRLSRAYLPRTFGHGRSYLARRLRWKVGYGGRLPHSIRLWMGMRQGALWGKFNSSWGMGFHNLSRKRALLRRCRRRRRRFTVAALSRWITLQRQQRWVQLRRRRRFFTALWLRRSVQRHRRRVSLEGATGQLRIYREAETMYRRLVAVPRRQRQRLRRQRLTLRLRRWVGLAALQRPVHSAPGGEG